MYRVTVDISDVEALERSARGDLDAVPRVMKAVAEIGASDERAKHSYQNRTGDLERGTRALVDRLSADGAMIELIMDTDYASYVVRRRLSTIQTQAVATEQRMQMALDAIAEKAAK